MEGGKERLLVPAPIILIIIGMTLWLSAGLSRNPLIWFDFGQDWKYLVPSIIAIGVTNLGFGYILNIIFVARFFSKKESRYADFRRFLSTFRIKIEDGRPVQDYYKYLEEPVLAEFHFRLHSRAPQSFIDWTIRRNTAWYIAKASAVASVIGWIIAFLIICSRKGSIPAIIKELCAEQIAGLIASIALFIFILPVMLSKQGTKWNKEFWEASLIWLHEDINAHGLPDRWPESLIERLPEQLTKGST